MDKNMKKKLIFVIALVMIVIAIEGFKFLKSKMPSQNVDINSDINNVVEQTPKYTIDDLDISVTILENGNLKIKESIVYNLINDSDKVFRNYTVKKFENNQNVYQPERLGISRIACDGEMLYEEILTETGFKVNKDKETGRKKYTVEYMVEDAVEKCNNVSEFLCNLNLGTFERDVNDLNITVKADNEFKILDAKFLGNQAIEFTIEDGILNASLDKYPAGESLWLNAKIENECVPNTNRIMLEDRAISFDNIMKVSGDELN